MDVKPQMNMNFQGAFPPPCGPESLFSLLDEKSLLKYARGTGLPEHGSPFRYFVLDNSIIIGLLEQPLGNYEGNNKQISKLLSACSSYSYYCCFDEN